MSIPGIFAITFLLFEQRKNNNNNNFKPVLFSNDLLLYILEIFSNLFDFNSDKNRTKNKQIFSFLTSWFGV